MKVVAGYEIGDREVTETTKKILRALREHAVVIFQRDDSPEGMETVTQVIGIAGEIGLGVYANNIGNGIPFVQSSCPYRIVIIDEDHVGFEVKQYVGKKVATPERYNAFLGI